jgi:hypothetical protein
LVIVSTGPIFTEVTGIIRLKREVPVLEKIKKRNDVEEEAEKRKEEENENEGVELERNIMEDPESRLRQPDNVDADLWAEVLRLNSYLGKGLLNFT